MDSIEDRLNINCVFLLVGPWLDKNCLAQSNFEKIKTHATKNMQIRSWHNCVKYQTQIEKRTIPVKHVETTSYRR